MMKPNDGSNSLPPDHAFVVQLHAAGEGGVCFTGRVEHVQSGRARWFESVDDVRAFMEDVVRSRERDAARAERLERLVQADRERHMAPRTTPVIRFLSSRLGVIERLESRAAKSA
jgi:hypothetical protein